MVPPIADNMSTNFADLSLMIRSNVGVSKKILTNLSLFFHSKSKEGSYKLKINVSWFKVLPLNPVGCGVIFLYLL